MILEYTDFTDFNDEIGHQKKADCYKSLTEAVSNSDVKTGNCTVVKAGEYYAVVWAIPTSYTTTIENLKDGYQPKPFEVWDGEVIEEN